MNKKRVALVTGAARGIGNGIARKLAGDGFDLVILDVLPKADVMENVADIEKAGANVLYFQGDITSKERREEVLTGTLETYGRVDVLVNNAGVAPKVRTDLLDMTEESYDFVMDINLKGTLFLTQLVAKAMMAASGSIQNYHPVIINIASISSYTSSVARGEYCLSKAGISMLTTLFADRLAGHGVLVYEIRPGIIYTPMTEVVKEKYDKLIGEGLLPIRRWGYPEDIAMAVSAFCSGQFPYSTGEVVNIDGGFHLRRL